MKKLLLFTALLFFSCQAQAQKKGYKFVSRDTEKVALIVVDSINRYELAMDGYRVYDVYSTPRQYSKDSMQCWSNQYYVPIQYLFTNKKPFNMGQHYVKKYLQKYHITNDPDMFGFGW